VTSSVAVESGRRWLAAATAFASAGPQRRAGLRDFLSGGALAPADRAAFERALADVDAVTEKVARLGWRFVAGPDLPAAVAGTSDPPLGLFCRGEIPGTPAVAIVGARRASAYGREVAEHFGKELAAAGAWVVSGMARGVDAAAHRGALAGGGRTAAVWGTGPDLVYPAENAPLAAAIAESGCLLTELPPGSRPLPHHFPARNRIIVGLVQAVLVVEADERSGALITAGLALDEGREVMAVPGSVFSRLSVGPNGLLRAGAAPAIDPADVIQALGLSPVRRGRTPLSPLLARIPRGEAVSVDALAVLAGWPVARVLEELLALELQGRIVRELDGRYRRSGAY
jgi:DNA processing protein